MMARSDGKTQEALSRLTEMEMQVRHRSPSHTN